MELLIQDESLKPARCNSWYNRRNESQVERFKDFQAYTKCTILSFLRSCCEWHTSSCHGTSHPEGPQPHPHRTACSEAKPNFHLPRAVVGRGPKIQCDPSNIDFFALLIPLPCPYLGLHFLEAWIRMQRTPFWTLRPQLWTPCTRIKLS
jgi:hypothetical protein